MKIKQVKQGDVVTTSFLPENEEEMRMMGTLRNHYFFGLSENNTYPEYDGIRTENNFVVEMKFKFNVFK